jgi:hypothetical protein
MAHLKIKRISKTIGIFFVLFCCFSAPLNAGFNQNPLENEKFREDFGKDFLHSFDAFEAAQVFDEKECCHFSKFSPDVLQALICRCALQGNLKLLRRLAKEGCSFDWMQAPDSCNPFICAAANGHVKVLKFLFEEVFLQTFCWGVDQQILNRCCICAAANGHLNVLKFLFRNIFPTGCTWFCDQEIIRCCCTEAAASGHLKVLKFLLTDAFPQSCTWFFDQALLDQCCIRAAANGHLRVLKFLFKDIFPVCCWFLDTDTLNDSCVFAVNNGHVDVVKFFVRDVFPLCPFVWIPQQDILESCF